MITPDANRLVVETDDAVSFSLLLATPLVRALSLIVDLGIIYAIQTLLSVLVMLIAPLSMDLSAAAQTLAFFILNVCYFIVLEISWDGRTVGKRLFRLRVVDAHIQRLSPFQVILRNLFRTVDMLPALYTLGGVICLSTRNYQRLGDIAASTLVIRTPMHTSPAIPAAAYNKFNSFRRYPHLEALLKKNTLPAEHTLALQAVLRRDNLDTQSRLTLFSELAKHFRTKAHFPDEITRDMTDEQYVRNCVDSLLPKAKPVSRFH